MKVLGRMVRLFGLLLATGGRRFVCPLAKGVNWEVKSCVFSLLLLNLPKNKSCQEG